MTRAVRKILMTRLASNETSWKDSDDELVRKIQTRKILMTRLVRKILMTRLKIRKISK